MFLPVHGGFPFCGSLRPKKFLQVAADRAAAKVSFNAGIALTLQTSGDFIDVGALRGKLKSPLDDVRSLCHVRLHLLKCTVRNG